MSCGFGVGVSEVGGSLCGGVDVVFVADGIHKLDNCIEKCLDGELIVVVLDIHGDCESAALDVW